MRLVLQLINGIVRVLQKLLKYLNGTIISTYFEPLFPVKSVNFCLSLNEALLPGKSAAHWHNYINLFTIIYLYSLYFNYAVSK